MSSIVTLAEADAAAEYISEFQVWHAVVATGTYQELNWVKYAPGSIYPLHSHHMSPGPTSRSSSPTVRRIRP